MTRLDFKVSLELSHSIGARPASSEAAIPKGYSLTEEDVESYRRVLENTLETQIQFAGLTPDHLSDEGLGVDLFTVEHVHP